jgi:hypothetical protein
MSWSLGNNIVLDGEVMMANTAATMVVNDVANVGLNQLRFLLQGVTCSECVTAPMRSQWYKRQNNFCLGITGSNEKRAASEECLLAFLDCLKGPLFHFHVSS